MRRLPPILQAARGPARALLRARPQGDEIVLTTYGRSSGFCVDPIEKKPLNHFLPGTPVLSFGTAGCNLACKFCQNWDISKARSSTACRTASPEAIVRAANAQPAARAVAFTYNDPVIFLEYAVDVAEACRERGIKTVAVTAGYICDERARGVLPAHGCRQHRPQGLHRGLLRKLCSAQLDAGARHAGIPGAGDEVWLEITTLLIPGHNDNPAEISALAMGDGSARPRRAAALHRLSPRLQDARRAADAAGHAVLAHGTSRSERGCVYVYTGNVHDEAGQSTYCHACGTRLIGRDWYQITVWKLTKWPLPKLRNALRRRVRK